MRIMTNTGAISSYNALASINTNMRKSIQKLSTGLKINSASDDAAGLAISEKMRSQVRGLDRAVANSQDGISMIQTAEGALNETTGMLQRMRELSVQAANDSLTAEDRNYIQLEIEQLKEEINRVANTTQFNKKKLLNGSADVLWSTDLLGIGVTVKGGLTDVDDFGQKIKQEGNYKISVSARDAGQGQVLKSNIFSVGVGDGLMTAGVNVQLEELINFVDKNGVSMLNAPQSLTVSLEGGKSVAVTVYAGDTIGSLGEKLSSAIIEASGVPVEGSAAQFVGSASGSLSDADPIIKGLATQWLDGAAKRIQELYGLGGNGKKLEVRIVDTLSDGRSAFVEGSSGSDVIVMTISREAFMPATPPDGLNGGFFSDDRIIAHEIVHAVLVADPNIAKELYHTDNRGMWMVEGIAEYIHGANVRVKADAAGTAIKDKMDAMLAVAPGNYDTLYYTGNTSAAYSASYLLVRYFDEQSLAKGGGGITQLLQELKNGKSMDEAMAASSGTSGLDSRANLLVEMTTKGPAFIAAVAGEDFNLDTGAIGGLYASKKSALGPSAVISGNGALSANPLGNYGWSEVLWPVLMPTTGAPSALARSDAKDYTLQSVEGTLLLHSPVVGSAGRITISGNEDFIKALGFAEIQEARDPLYQINITDAHSGKSVASNVVVSGNKIIGALHSNIDIRMLDNFALGIDGRGTFSGGYGSFKFLDGASYARDFVVHLVSNATVLQIGANEGEDLTLNFGDMGAAALGVDKVRVFSHEQAARSITVIDNALERVSSRRAGLGAYQNRLEHTINNLTAASTNLTASESRIRDTDMAREMLNFTKLNIFYQGAVSMLSQANQLPQSVLRLMN